MQKPIAFSRHLVLNIIRNIEMDIGVAKKTSNGKYQVEFFDREKKTLE